MTRIELCKYPIYRNDKEYSFCINIYGIKAINLAQRDSILQEELECIHEEKHLDYNVLFSPYTSERERVRSEKYVDYLTLLEVVKPKRLKTLLRKGLSTYEIADILGTTCQAVEQAIPIYKRKNLL